MTEKRIGKTGKGAYLSQSWAAIRNCSGPAPDPEQLESFLMEVDEDKMLSRAEVSSRIINYFNSIINKDESGYVWREPPTKSALALCLGISVKTLTRYAKGEYYHGKYQDEKGQIIASEDFDLIRRALLIINNFYEAKLSENRNVAGCIFWLLNSKNEQWSNTQEVEIRTAAAGRLPQRSREDVLGIEDAGGVIDVDDVDAELPDFD